MKIQFYISLLNDLQNNILTVPIYPVARCELRVHGIEHNAPKSKYRDINTQKYLSVRE